jgi:hypothetical protein
MKLQKRLFRIFCVLYITCFVLLCSVCTAQEAKISVKNVTVQLLETRAPVGTRVVHVYTIIAILSNTGDIKSDEISVFFHDPEFNTTTTPPLRLSPFNISIGPHENQTFILQNWPTPLTGDVPINISYTPSAPTVVETIDNSGYYVYTLHIGGSTSTKSTPGFEVLIVFIALFILLLRKQLKP